jgi:TP901 family phage tail tape measure protein
MGFIVPTIFKAIDQMTGPVEKIAKSVGLIGEQGDTAMARVDRRFSKLADASANIAKKTAIAGLAIMAPLALAANEAVQFEDKMADVAKTTGLSGDGLKKYGNDLLTMSASTRTGIDDLIKISEIGGQLGVDNTELLSFTDAMNKFNVALGSDFAGGIEEASSQVGKIKSLFKETQGIKIAEAITKTGSAINELGAIGAGTSANITEFALRMGQLPAALRPSLQDTLALGTFLEESGLDAQIASGGLTRFFLVAGEHIRGFANQMGISADKAKEMLASNPAEFAKKFATSLQGLRPDELATKLGKLGIGTQETIKVLGSLGTNIKRVGELQEVASTSFGAGSSLLEEYNKKNETTAAQLQKSQNNFKALAIIIGTELIPVLSDVLKTVLPVIKGVIGWAKENPELTKTILTVTAAIGGFMFLISGISGAVALVSNAMLAWSTITKAVTFAQALLNIQLWGNPIGLIILGIIALVAVLALVIAKYDEWGAALTFILGPFGMLINLFMAFKRNWDRIVEAFNSGGFMEGIKAIGTTILDFLLMPLQQVLDIVAKVTGMDWAANMSKEIQSFRSNLGVVNQESKIEAVDPEGARMDRYGDYMKAQNQNINMTIHDKTGRATMESDNKIFMPKLTSTQ